MRISLCEKLTSWWTNAPQQDQDLDAQFLVSDARPTNGWIPAASAAIGSVAALVLRGFNLGSVSNALSSAAAGALGMGACYQVVPDEQTQAVERVASAVFGQIPVFFLSQLYANTEDPVGKQLATTGIAFCLGAQIVSIGHRLKRDYGIRIETTDQTGGAAKFPPPVIPDKVRPFLKLGASVGFGVGAALWDDTVLREMLAFLSTYYAGHLVGNWASGRIVSRIRDADEQGRGTNWRITKAVADAICFLGIPFVFIPFNREAFSPSRIAQLPFVGAACGVAQGFIGRPIQERWASVPIEQLDELKELLSPPGAASRIEDCIRGIEQPNSVSQFSLAYRIFEGVLDPAAILGVAAFGVWQAVSLPNRVDQAAIGVMTAAFFAAAGLGQYADSWSLEERTRYVGPIGWQTRMKDVLVRFLANPTVAGLNCTYALFAGFNALPMDSQALREQSEEYQAWNTFLWTLYGLAMGFEWVQARSKKRWPFPRIGYMALVNSALTFQRMSTGVIE